MLSILIFAAQVWAVVGGLAAITEYLVARYAECQSRRWAAGSAALAFFLLPIWLYIGYQDLRHKRV